MEPTWAERARTLLLTRFEGSLATVDLDGRPYVATVPFVPDASGAPVIVLSNLSQHTIRAHQDRRAAISLGDRLLIQGDLEPVPGLQQVALTDAFVERHPDQRPQVESLDFSWFRLAPERVRWIDADGTEQWLRAEDLAGAEPDPLIEHGLDFPEEVRARLADEALLIVKVLGGRWLASEASVVDLDRYGVVFSATEPAGTRDSRVPFPERIEDADDIHAAIGALVAAARAGAARDDLVEVDPEVEAARRNQPSAASLLDAIEGDGGGAPDVDGIDAPAHGDSHALFDSLQSAGGEAWALSPEEERDALALAQGEFIQGDGIVSWGEPDHSESGVDELTEPVGECLEPGIGESEGLAHGDAAAAPVERVTTGGVAEERVDAETSSAPQDDAHVGGIVDGLEHDDRAKTGVSE